MASMKRRVLVVSMLVLVTLIASACRQPFSEAPSVTSTPINPDSLFATPLGQPTDMTDVQNFATGTALAIQSGTPLAGGDSVTPGLDGATVTPTSIIQLPTDAVITPTATLAVSTGQPGVTSQPAATSVPGVRPATYTLQSGEFPYCIARRFNVNPEQLLAANGLTDGQLLYPGRTLTIPQTGTFPGDRMLRSHPTTYTVASSGENLYSVACRFGDVDPSAIASANNLSVGASLTAGQTLSIP